MHITLLRLENFRNIAQAEVSPHPGLNLIYGDNGAGKTSLLEAIYLLSHGRSFRAARAEEITRRGADNFRIFLETREEASGTHRLGLERSGDSWRARIDGVDASLLSQLSRHIPLVLMEPNSHALISGPPENRRRLLDWGVFHVEPDFLEDWRRYARALRQRNAALRQREMEMLDGLDAILADLGGRLDSGRRRHFPRLSSQFGTQLSALCPELQDIVLDYRPGWRGGTLAEALARTRERDLAQGMTSQGPHRADIELLRAGQLVRTTLSRGETKSLAASMLLTQAQLISAAGERPLILFDDLASEFDQQHAERVLEQALALAGQLWITGVNPPVVVGGHALFHVEHGAVRRVL